MTKTENRRKKRENNVEMVIFFQFLLNLKLENKVREEKRKKIWIRQKSYRTSLKKKYFILRGFSISKFGIYIPRFGMYISKFETYIPKFETENCYRGNIFF